MAKVAISISMDAAYAAELKIEAESGGEKFSPMVCRYIQAGRNLERGLMSSTSSPNLDIEPVLSDDRQDPEMSPKERVYSCITDEPQDLGEIAERSGLPEAQVGDIVDELANSGEPICLKVIDGSWRCWQGS